MNISLALMVFSGFLFVILLVLIVVLVSRPVKKMESPRKKEEIKKIKRSVLDSEEEDF
ncbi:MAG: hypothetical protein AABW80_01555 [Nanoarchaeota archaeon]